MAQKGALYGSAAGLVRRRAVPRLQPALGCLALVITITLAYHVGKQSSSTVAATQAETAVQTRSERLPAHPSRQQIATSYRSFILKQAMSIMQSRVGEPRMCQAGRPLPTLAHLLLCARCHAGSGLQLDNLDESHQVQDVRQCPARVAGQPIQSAVFIHVPKTAGEPSAVSLSGCSRDLSHRRLHQPHAWQQPFSAPPPPSPAKHPVCAMLPAAAAPPSPR
jgi:hypothetical protein